ncbi:MAG: cupin domain-containing protein [Lachnospiraceae bacterium]|nr:cupin domain-containing protein [Lachnospiraceae bacterium]
MDHKNLFEKFNEGGRLLLPDTTVVFDAIPWFEHPVFEGVELKHIITAEKTAGQFSFHLVRIAPNKKIGDHIHEKQLETHEVIAGAGVCVHNGVELPYEAGVISIFPIGVPHEVIAGENGLYLFAKFMPALY